MITSESISITSPTQTQVAERIAAILPAFNENAGIRGVLEVLRQVDILDEILVVDDGSNDGTRQSVLQFAAQDERIRLICHAKNRGKGQAVFTGWENTPSSILVLLDADLINLKPSQVVALLRPVLTGEADMTIGLFRHGRLRTDLAHWGTPWLTGQRCLRSELLGSVSRPAAQGYGLETAITVTASLERWRVRRVWLYGVSHPHSENHRGFIAGTGNRIKMYSHIIKAWFAAGGFNLIMPDRRND